MDSSMIMRYVQAVLSRIWMLVIFAMVGFIGAYVFASVTYSPYYTTTLKMMVVSSDSAQISVGDISTFKSVISSYFVWLKTSDFYESVATESGLGLTSAEVGGMLTYESDESEVFTVTVKTGAMDTCKIVADSAETMIPRFLNGKYSRVAVYVLESSGDPYVNANNAVSTAIIGALLGLVIAVVVAVLWEVFDVRVKNEKDLVKHYDYPILGTIPEFISATTVKKRSKQSYAKSYAQAYAKAEAERKENEQSTDDKKADGKEEK